MVVDKQPFSNTELSFVSLGDCMVKEIPSLGMFRAASMLSSGLVLYMGLFVLLHYRTLWISIMKFQYAL